jgi:hypothetical protein
MTHLTEVFRDHLRKCGCVYPIPQEFDPEPYYFAGVLPPEKRKVGRAYLGLCRNASVALWDGKLFHYVRTKWGQSYVEKICPIETNDGYDLFVPMCEANASFMWHVYGLIYWLNYQRRWRCHQVHWWLKQKFSRGV